jgi:hypothetical protein
MKARHTGTGCLLILTGLLALASASRAAIQINNFQLTPTSVSFDISGTLPATPPGSSRHSLIFSNPSILAYPGFALGEFNTAQSISFSGSQTLGIVSTGGSQFGDYFYAGFVTENWSNAYQFQPGEAINGHLTANWSMPAFDLSATSYLNFYWGDATGSSLQNTGVLLTTVPVPEPSALCLLGLCALVGYPCRSLLGPFRRTC